MNKCDNFMRSWARSFDLFKAKCYTGSPVDQEFPTKAPEISQPSPGGLAVQMEIDEDTAEAKTEILKKGSFFGNKIGFIESNQEYYVNIDTMDDWEKAEKKLTTLYI